MEDYKRTGRVVVLMSVYNVEKLIGSAMTSLLPIADEYHVHDGRYEMFQCPCGSQHDNSCDSSMKEVEKFAAATGAKVKVTMHQVMPEFDKRNLMFDAVPEGDTCVIADDDEIFYGQLSEVRQFGTRGTGYDQYRAGSLICARWRHSFDPMARFFIKTEGLRHKQDKPGAFSYTFGDAMGLFVKEDYSILPNVRMINLYGTYSEIGYREQKRDGARAAYNELGINNRLPTGKTSM